MKKEIQFDSPGSVIKEFLHIYKRKTIPLRASYTRRVKRVIYTLLNEDSSIRPPGSSGRPGGLLYLHKEIPTLIVPDLHGRMDFFLAFLTYKPGGEQTVLEMVHNGKLQIVCVGDGFHGEKRAALRWKAAFQEFQTGFKKHKNMDEEMRESMGLMEMVMILKTLYPCYYHFLKGNHENIKNENAHGNKPFGKFAYEGEMVKIFVEKFYGEEFIDTYALFERLLPLLAVNRDFIISHAEPRTFHNKESILDYTKHPDVIYDLTWTADNAAEENSVTRMLEYYLGKEQARNAYYFGGHRPVKEIYNPRAGGKYLQIHNPEKFILAYLKPGRLIDPERDIFEINKLNF